MLSIMRRQAGSWIIKVLLFAIVVVFVFWGVGSFNARRDTTVAEVNGEVITYDMFRDAYSQLRERYRQAYGDAFDDDMLKSMQLENQAVEQLVNRALILQEAKRLNVHVAEETIDQAIYNLPAFQSNGVFDESRARMLLAQNRMSTADFRSIFRQDLLIDKMKTMIVNGAVATEAEAKEWYDWSNAQINLAYVHFPADRYQDITITDEQIAEYFKSHEDQYRTEPQVKVQYLFFDPDRYKDQVTVGSEQIAEYYYGHPEEFKTEKSIEARHILLKLDQGADPETVANKKQKAMTIYEAARSGKPFDELARQYSEGPTRDQGGYLGEFKKETMVKPFADKAFAMQAGEISEPVRTRFGWHIIKVEKVNEAQTRSLEEATDAIREKLVVEEARERALQKAEEVYDATLLDGVSLADVGRTHDVPVKTTGFFEPGGPESDEVGDPRLFAETAFGLREMAVSEILHAEDGYYLLQVVDRIESSIPPLETVKEDVSQDLLEMLRDERAKSDAEAFLAELQKGKRMAEVDEPLKAESKQTGFFKRTGAIPQIGYEPEISKAAFELGPEKKTPDKAFKGQQGWYVFQLKERKLPDNEEFEKEKRSLMDRLSEQKKQAAFQQWLTDLKTRGRIDINYELVMNR